MYAFSRSVRLAPGNAREAMTWASEVTEQVNQITGLGVRLFTQVWSPEFGRVSWACFVPDLSALEAANDKLLADDSFAAKVDQGARFLSGGIDDTLGQILHGTPDPNRNVEYVTAVRAVCAHGNIQRGIEVGMEIAQKAESITGLPTLFMSGATGVYGQVGWATGHENVQSIDAAQAALMGDPTWMQLIDDKAGEVYAQAPSPMQVVLRRLG
jgi:hypothetical protein